MNRRQEALSCYKEALAEFSGRAMRNGQFSLVINRPWIEQRIKSPFTMEILRLSRQIESFIYPPAETELNQFIHEATTLHLTNDLLWVKLGVYLLHAGQTQRALQLFKKSERYTHERFSCSYHPLVWQGHALDCLDRRNEAITCYRRALQKAPQNNTQPDYYPFTMDGNWIEKRLERTFDPTVLDALEDNRDYFTPGNVVLSDCTHDRLIELQLDDDKAGVVQIIKWNEGENSRRRPLGISFNQNGYLYVGITAVPDSQANTQFPTGIAEILTISPSGEQRFVRIPPDYLKKPAWVNSSVPGKVFLMSNNLDRRLPIHAYRLRLSRYKRLGRTSISEIIPFMVSKDQLSNGRPFKGKNGRIYVPCNKEQRIQVFSQTGGRAIRSIDTKDDYHFIAPIKMSHQLIALTRSAPGMPANEIHRIDYEGRILDRCELETYGVQSVWNAACLPDSLNRFVVADYNSTEQSFNKLFIFDANNLSQPPTTLDIDWGKHERLTEESYFDIQVVPEISQR